MQAQVLQLLFEGDAHVEIHHARILSAERHVRADTFGGSQVQVRVHRIAAPLHITTVFDIKFFQRDDRQGIFYNTTGKGISSVQDHLALRGILERKVATPFEFDFAGAVGGNVGVQPYGLVDADGQQHIQAAQRQRGFLPASVHQRVFE